MYRSKSQFQILARLMALVMLLSQSVFALASMNASMSHPMDMKPATDKATVGCHTMVIEQHASMDEQDKSCQQDCCDKHDCSSHCQSCFTITAGALIPVMTLLHQANFSQQVILKSNQIPNGFDPSQLYRPPRQAI